MDGDTKGANSNENDSDWRKDKGNIALLFILYVLQGIPLGFAGSIPYILMTKKVDYASQALFSFAFYPFSFKLLWAPIVDSVFSRKVGRRKSWLIPVQYLLGLFMLYISFRVNDLLGVEGDQPAQINLLVFLFTSLNFFAATQDIVVDGWALSMLAPENVGYASTCNSVGQTFGYFISYTVFLAFESKDFCNEYFYPMIGMDPQATGALTLDGFMYFWGVVFIISTTLVWIFKREKEDNEFQESLTDSYKALWKILWLPVLKQYILFTLTSRIAFAAADAITGLKMIEAGMKKEKLALLAVPLTPVQLILPLIISRITAGPKPMTKVWMNAYPFRLVFGLIFAWVVYITPGAQTSPGEFPSWFYLLLITVFIGHQMFTNSMFVAIMAFHAQVSDPTFGGTYMTMLNTFTNFGGNWPNTVALWLVEKMTTKTCSIGGQSCNSAEGLEVCTASGGECVTTSDGYYSLSVVLCVFGFVWLFFMRKVITRFQNMSVNAWKVT